MTDDDHATGAPGAGERETGEPEARGPETGEPRPPVRGAVVGLLTLAVIVLIVYLIARILVARGEQIPPASPASLPSAGPIAAGFRPSSISFLDESRGLISGTTPCATCGSGVQGVIASTGDGGRTWQIRYRNDRPLLGLTHIGGTGDVWATATACDDPSFVGCHRSYVRSADLGQTWRPEAPTNGYRVSPPPRAGHPCRRDHPFPVASSFPTPRHGWLFCAYTAVSSSYQFKGLYETFDAGKRWIELPEFHPLPGGKTVNPANMPTDGFASGISFLRNGDGLLWTSGKYSSLSYTTRGGRRWTRVWHVPAEGGQQIVSASLIGPATGYVLTLDAGRGYSLGLTRDGGRTWSPVQAWPTPAPAAAASPG